MKLSIEATGAFTPVGRNLSLTMASIYTKVQRYDDLGLTDRRGEPLSGARTPLTVTELVPRLGHLAGLALSDCHLRAPRTALRPLVFYGPDDLADERTRSAFLEAFFASLALDVRDAVQPARRIFVTQDSGGFHDALERALREASTASSSNQSGCYLVSVDSLSAPEKAQQLLRQGDLMAPGQAQGLLPGEGGIALLVNNARPGSRSPTLAAAFERDDDKPCTGRGLTRAILRAFTLASVAPGSSLGLVHDTAFDRQRAEELAYARARAPLVSVRQSQMFSPLLSTGDLGVANAALEVALAAFLLEKGVIPSPALATMGENGTNRGALVVTQPALTQEAAIDGR